MLQDAGLALEDITGILEAATLPNGRPSPGNDSKLSTRDRHIAKARDYLSGALLCRYDHPATDCKIMGAEIDRRLAEGQVAPPPRA